ncbi:hypothetical protein [Pseudonocardia endophytica]|uniref:Biopolymer transporter Tol n=1 Tax=Pseudonocardia endophytica TaxID=401976 RepID=A0A4R1HZU5_PSEEN|nr:hypothetical protein [Pseudonocardia endophytica]TCK25689.1 hypothetical protein EV378_1506 [Pseudonocardia endophytica]
MAEPERTPDGRYIVVRGRRWRAADPELPDHVRDALQHHLGRARSGVRTAERDGDDDAVRRARNRVNTAKHGLGERGSPWWDLDLDDRRNRWERALSELDRDGRHRGALGGAP